MLEQKHQYCASYEIGVSDLLALSQIWAVLHAFKAKASVFEIQKAKQVWRDQGGRQTLCPCETNGLMEGSKEEGEQGRGGMGGEEGGDRWGAKGVAEQMVQTQGG